MMLGCGCELEVFEFCEFFQEISNFQINYNTYTAVAVNPKLVRVEDIHKKCNGCNKARLHEDGCQLPALHSFDWP